MDAAITILTSFAILSKEYDLSRVLKKEKLNQNASMACLWSHAQEMLVETNKTKSQIYFS